jgi:predicted GNAT family acetyltransferase
VEKDGPFVPVTRLAQTGPGDVERLRAFFATQPERSTYLAGWVQDGGLTHSSLAPRGWLLAELDQGEAVVGAVYVSSTGILIPVIRSETAVEQLVGLARLNPGMVRVLVGDRWIVRTLEQRLRPLGLVPRLARDQLVYSTTATRFQADADPLPLRPATRSDLDELVEASAAMAREEAQDDPHGRNPRLFRERIETRVLRGRDFVFRHGETLAFKANVSALSAVGGQIEGVYTEPGLRRRGFARRGTSSLTAWILERSARAVLLVNDDNLAARRLYEDLGFAETHESRTVFMAP